MKKEVVRKKVQWLFGVVPSLLIFLSGPQAEAGILDFFRGFTASGEAEVGGVGGDKDSGYRRRA